jgi:hypothetical protein
MTGDLRGAIERDRVLLQERAELMRVQHRLQALERLPGVRVLVRLRAIGPWLYSSPRGRLVLERVWRPVKRRLLGS